MATTQGRGRRAFFIQYLSEEEGRREKERAEEMEHTANAHTHIHTPLFRKRTHLNHRATGGGGEGGRLHGIQIIANVSFAYTRATMEGDAGGVFCKKKQKTRRTHGVDYFGVF